MLDVRNYEKAKHLVKVRKQYAAPAEDAGPTIYNKNTYPNLVKNAKK